MLIFSFIISEGLKVTTFLALIGASIPVLGFLPTLSFFCLQKNVPNDVPGIAFLSGGQSEIESSKNLNEINKINNTDFLITFSYGRGLQASALKEFGKNQEDTENIQKAFNHRARMNGLSSKGEWSENLEKDSAA